MEEKMSKSKHRLFLLSVMLTSFAVMYSTIFQVINYNIYEAYPGQESAVNFFISGPYVLVMLVSFISPVIYNKTNRKYSLLTACVIFTVSALLFTVQTSIQGFITVNLICGAASAYINVSAVTIIAEYYTDESVKSKYLGYYNFFMAAAGTLFSIVSGVLARVSWTGAFDTYWSSVLMTAMIFIFMPSLPAEKKNVSENGSASKGKANISMLGTRYWILVMNYIVLGLTYFVPGFFLSLYIAEHSLGDITYVGFALSVDTFGGAVFAFFFGYTYKIFKSYSSVAAFILMSGVLFLLYFFPNPVLLVMIVVLMGGSYMTTISYGYQEASAIVPKSCLSMSMGIIVGVQYISTFFAAYITTGLMKLLRTDKLTPVLIFPACWILVFAFIEYCSIRSYEKSKHRTPEISSEI